MKTILSKNASVDSQQSFSCFLLPASCFLLLASCFLLLASCLLLPASNAIAGGPISIGPSGVASKWESPISLHPETGSCATFSNAEMLDKIEENISYWEDISGIDVEFSIIPNMLTEGGNGDGNGGSSQSSSGCSLAKRIVKQQSVDVDEDNYNTYYVDAATDPGLDDSLNPVVFDDNGEIVDDLFGIGSMYSVLGFAGPDGYTDATFATIADGQAFFNCRCLAGNAEGACPGSIEFTTDDLDFTMTHEIGHLIGLDHTQVNQAIEDATCDTSVDGDCDDIPTMYPRSADAADQISPSRDDEVSALSLYGLTYLTNNFCTVTGSLTDSDGDPLRCADVQATTSDTADTIAQVSGVMAPATDSNADGDTGDSGECDSNCGDFTLRGLDPSKTYTITVQPIDNDWKISLGSSLGPCGTSVPSGIVEEVIATVTVGTCAAGGTRSLGTINTLSTGGVADAVAVGGSMLIPPVLSKPSNTTISILIILFTLLPLLFLRKSVEFKNY